MSSFLVSQTHVAAIVNFACRSGVDCEYRWDGEWHVLAREDPERVGQILLDQNARSVAYRYGDDIPAVRFRLRPLPSTCCDPVRVLKALDCLEYNSCDSPEWEGSESAAIIDAIRRHAITRLPGYEEAEWDIPESRLDYW